MIKFGTAGNSESFYNEGYKKTEQAPEFLEKRNLDCFEYPFGRGVRMSDEKAISIGNAFKEKDKEISIHAPYFINFANKDDEMAEKSYNYVLESAYMAKLMDAHRIVFHSATQGKMSREEAVSLTEKRLHILRDKIYEGNYENIRFCPETMGKIAQIGSIEEIVRFCKIDKIYTPCVDFGHVNAREQGSLKTEEDYYSRLSYMVDQLGYDRMKNFHVHFSKIMYSTKGEVKHLTFDDVVYGPEFYPLAVVLKKMELEPYIISESAGTQAEDAAEMKKIYNNL